jgi:hypothetical protein
MKRRIWLQVQGLWFAAWSSRASFISQKWADRAHRWKQRSEKFFQQINGGHNK